MTVAKYLRLSSEDTDLKSAGKAESNSIANQRNLLDTYIAQHKEFSQAQLVEFCDDGWSGKNFERPGVQALLEQVKVGKVQCIIVKDLSRFGRDYLTVGNYISKIFPFMGVRFIAVNDGLDSAKPGDVDSLDTSFKALLYDLYSRDLSRKIRSVKRFRAERGDFLAPFAPYGYVKNPENHNQLVIDPPAAEVVQRIFCEVAEGRGSMEIARELNDEGIPTPMLYKRAAGCSRTRWPSVKENNLWTWQMVSKIIRDARYIGTNVYGKRVRDVIGSTHTIKVSRADWITVEGTHEGIVTRDEFDRAQAALRAFKERDIPAKKYASAGKIRCGVCGHTLTRSHSKDKFYSCQTMLLLSGADCAEVCVAEKDLLTELQKNLRAQVVIALDRERFLAEQRKIERENSRAMLKQLEALQGAYEQCCRESRELYEAFALGNLEKEEYLLQKAALAKRKETLSGQKADLQSALDSQEEVRPNPFVEKCRPLLQMDEVPMDIIWELLKEVRVYPHGQLEIEWVCTDALDGI